MSFGPNVRATADGRRGYFHHREPTYFLLLRDTVNLFRHQFGVGDEFDVLIMSGSGTMANEAVMWSLRKPVMYHFHPRGGEFTSRLKRLCSAQHAASDVACDGEHYAFAHYETAEARLLNPHWDAMPHAQLRSGGVRFADCVSSFPYYIPPLNADVWTTVSSKQLGALPIVSVVVIKRAVWPYFRELGAYSILNLRRYADSYHRMMASPHTPAIAALADFHDRLEQFDVRELRAVVNFRAGLLMQTAKEHLPEAYIEGQGPVLLVKREAISPQLAARWNLYQSEHGWQFFLYSGTSNEYHQFAEQWRTDLKQRGVHA